MDKNDTMKKIERLYMDEIEPQKEVDDKILGKKPRKPLTPEQKERNRISNMKSRKRNYDDFHVTLNRNHHQDVIDYTKASDKSPTQIYIELVRKEINK